MCGIAGIITADPAELSLHKLKQMTAIIAHRGPDGDGHWINTAGTVGLAHRRLSILDLSHAADQPMHYMNRYTIVFNGEIYNYVELKAVLIEQGYRFNTTGDTEVLMALYHRDKEQCLQLLDGMFAFVIYDNVTNEIFAARDRFGEKPFYYSYKKNGYFIFGSEMKCIWEAGIKKEVEPVMLYNYLAQGFVINPGDASDTFYQNCKSLPHSHYLKLSLQEFSLSIQPYYNINWQQIDYGITVPQAKEKLHELFYTSVSRRLRSDVSVGSSLSGGLDSSLVVTVIDNLKKGTTQQQNTFSAVFPGFKKDERQYIDHVIAKTNVLPHFVTPGDEGLINSMDTLSWHQEEPFGSASIYAQYCVMQLAKQEGITVLLDGQGADEMMAGYHVYYSNFFKELKKNHPAMYAAQKKAYQLRHADNDINKSVLSNTSGDVKEMLKRHAPFLEKWVQKSRLNYLDKDFYETYKKQSFTALPVAGTLNEALYNSIFKFGLQELLRYADRNSMAHSREVRLPFLYHELVEFLFSLPPYFKINEGWTKWIMRETFTSELPPQIGWRKDKIGYEPPQQSWMQNQQIKNKVAAGAQALYQKKIIKSASQPAETGLAAYRGKNWRFLMAGQIL